jgi:hypothetical protein
MAILLTTCDSFALQAWSSASRPTATPPLRLRDGSVLRASCSCTPLWRKHYNTSTGNLNDAVMPACAPIR